MSGMKVIRLNGDPVETGAQNIRDLLVSLDLPAQSLLVEHNGVALRRDEWPQRTVTDGDRVELVRIVAGG
jgi:sulfur carrier protein